MRPDPEIAEFEKRLALRRARLEHAAHDAGRRALKGLASPAVLVGAAALGFIAGGGARRRRGGAGEGTARRAGTLGLMMSVALWLVRAQFGSPAAAAQFALSRLKLFLRSFHRDSSPVRVR